MPDSICVWTDCRNPAHADMPICFVHAYLAHREIHDLLTAEQTEPALPKTPCVYYLAISPNTVKIGTTTDLVGRMRGLRTNLQYVLAVELGGREVERMRHQQFAAERISRREDFTVSDRLRAHIETLRADGASDVLLEHATRERARR